MIITEICQLRPKSKMKRVKMEDGSSFVLYSGEIRRMSFLREGNDLSREERDTIFQEILLPRAKKRCLHLLEKQDYTSRSLIRKLTQGGYPEELAEAAVAYAASFHYVDDLRYAQNFVRFHQDKKSVKRLRMDLMAKGVSSDLIDMAIETELTVDETAQIQELLKKKHYDPTEKDPKIKAKMYRFLAGRGYASSLILDAMRSYEDDVFEV
ncbi:regulatory protein [Lachnospiraceae bacterium KHCPX20]|jgi:regulatory protein|nr:regulatory protein [Lachnospiraceae bacterium KHCPX20]